MATSDGGFAFPLPATEQNYVEYGMSLRDWFAGQAIASGLCNGVAKEWELTQYFGKNVSGVSQAQIVAAQAYSIADAMIKKRNE